MLAIIDYGVGNLRSLEKAFAHVGVNATVSAEEQVLALASHLVLPGVGAFGSAMKELKTRGLDHLVQQAATDGKPILGICLGFQMLFDESHEFGLHEGLGLLPGRVVKFPESSLNVPHVGWNQAHQCRFHTLFQDVPNHSFFYFVHSYYVEASQPDDVLATTDYGFSYPSVCARSNIMGIQFHPEKSQSAGLQMLKNFSQV